MQSIADWLAGNRNYDEGVALYLQLGDDKQFKEMFREQRTAFKEKKLVELLRKLNVKSYTLKATEEKKAEQVAADAATNNFGWPVAMNVELHALWQEWKPKYSEFMNLTNRLYDVALLGKEDNLKEMEAGNMAHRILDLRDEIKEIYKARDHYLQHGSFPGKAEVFTPVVANDIKIADRRLSVRRYLTRYYGLLQKPAKSERIRMNQIKKFDVLKKEMMWLNKKLNKPEDEGIPGKTKQVDHSKGEDQKIPD